MAAAMPAGPAPTTTTRRLTQQARADGGPACRVRPVSYRRGRQRAHRCCIGIPSIGRCRTTRPSPRQPRPGAGSDGRPRAGPRRRSARRAPGSAGLRRRSGNRQPSVSALFSCRDEVLDFLVEIKFSGREYQPCARLPSMDRSLSRVKNEERLMRVGLAMALLVFLGLAPLAQAADAPSAWTEIMSSHKLNTCVVPGYQPYSWVDKDGQWQGFAVEMAKDTAKNLRADPVFIETSFKTVVLDLQSGKCDVFYGFNATPERALAIDFAGPLYTLGFGALDRPGWSAPGDRWADLNNPDIRVCYSVGNSSEQQIKRFAPKSTQVALASSEECALALLSGR